MTAAVVYLIPLLLLLNVERQYVTAEFGIVIFAIGVVMWTIFTLAIVRLGLGGYKHAKAHREVQQTGVPVSAEVVRSEERGREKDMAKLRIDVRFRNLSGSDVERELDIVDSKPYLRRYEPGNRINLRLNQKSHIPPFTVDSAKITVKFPFGYLAWAVFNVAYSVGLFLAEYHLYGQGFGLRFLWPFSIWLFPPVLFYFTFAFVSVRDKDEISTAKNDRQTHQLTLYGVVATGEIINYRQTGHVVNENPEVEITIQFLNRYGQKEQHKLSQVIHLVDLYLLGQSSIKVLYLPDDPSVFEITREI
ncbi:hypothetical protein [Trueperella bialowiezensis]|uniref:Protein of uncharacterized function (DUF3592) n=1 Tax=Trueperella bialowiezensis TaxID=312285 RepID=A0A448PF38_9ACTO|nr:hypothetical protein [Trueperella bialowiezensis]VEI13518.1 Protein of uncharacterised function (DUF3592) [Trueperella bialowiezensis]